MPRDLLPEGLLAQPVWEMALEIPGVCVFICASVHTQVCICIWRSKVSVGYYTHIIPICLFFFFLFLKEGLCVGPGDH